MSLIKMILKAAVPIPKIEKHCRFLFVGPHPDDIEIGAGATAVQLSALGKDICFLVCLDGRFRPVKPSRQLVSIWKVTFSKMGS